VHLTYRFVRFAGTLVVRVSEQGAPKKKKTKEQTITLENSDTTRLLNLRGKVVIIEVIDDGVGMTPNQVKTAFNDGTQFNSNQLQAGGGSGLGLSIAKGIAEQHNGSLECSSAGLEKGATFTLSLPLYEYDSTEEEETKATDALNVDDTIKTVALLEAPEQLRILVVDDSVTNRKLCIRLLEKQGHTCVGACDGLEAVAAVRDSMDSEKANLFDCILLDYEMPNMNGPEACKEMRNLGSSAFIVGVTGNVMSEDVAHFRNCGANWVLPKPFRLEALEQQLVENGTTGSGGGQIMKPLPGKRGKH
jgi:CheY-like chemotaxis protein